MRYRYLVDLRRGISVFAIFSYGIAVLGTPQCPPLQGRWLFFLKIDTSLLYIFQYLFWGFVLRSSVLTLFSLAILKTGAGTSIYKDT